MKYLICCFFFFFNCLRKACSKNALTNDRINEEMLGIGVRGGLTEEMEVTQPTVDGRALVRSCHVYLPNLLPH